MRLTLGLFEGKGSKNQRWLEAKDAALEGVGWCIQQYASKPCLRACVEATGILLLLFGIDSLSGHSLALRMMYIAPIWYAAQRGGRRSGLILAGLTTLLLGIVDKSRLAQYDSIVAHMAVHFAILASLTLLIESQESRLKNYVDLATSDSLTGVGNRVSFERYAKKALHKAITTGDNLSLVMIDLDSFKELNDRFGHNYGDHALRTAGRLLRRSFQHLGHVARIGGDEFVVVLPGRRAEDLPRILERVSDRYEAATRILDVAPTLSFGVGPLISPNDTLEELIDRADRNMYSRKSAKKVAIIEVATSVAS
ncbi:MAG TPA: GGDEF domain-containing protein [Fimbriimonadaceae bacterium]|nr:GGDEF domain-containing protein [Fimbriimonadaceae bacterium]